MNPEIIEYITNNRICVLAIEMMDGSPHAATVHYAHHGSVPVFIFQTNPKYRKSEALFGREESRASLVIGFEESERQRTFQADGVVSLLKPTDKELEHAYLTKFPGKDAKYSTDVFLKFTPTWWRYTDWGKPEGKTVYLSDGSVTVMK